MRNPTTYEAQNQSPSFETFGCRVNAVDPDELFQRYEDAGFLYPAKMERLRPFWSRIVQNWRHAMEAGDSLLWFSTYEEPNGAWSSVSSFRTTHSTWNTQHAVAIGGPMASRAVLLSAAAVRSQPRFAVQDEANQNWFRPSNRFAQKVFGSIEETLGAHRASVGNYEYVAMPKETSAARGSDIRIVSVEDNRAGWQDDLVALAYATRGRVYAVSEELEHDDLELETLDEMYRRVGLRRYRRIWLAYSLARRRAVGAAVAYRGPLGLNLSFLENRCDLMISPGLSQETAGSVARRLIGAASPEYSDFEPNFVPVVADESAADKLVEAGGRTIRRYSQAAFLRSGYGDWYRHVDRFYARIVRRMERRAACVYEAA